MQKRQAIDPYMVVPDRVISGERSGCEECGDGNVMWTGKNAAFAAANHARKTGHHAWYECITHIEYTPSLNALYIGQK